MRRHHSDWRHADIANRKALEDFLSSQDPTNLESLETFLNSQNSNLESDATRALLQAAIRHIREKKSKDSRAGEGGGGKGGGTFSSRPDSVQDNDSDVVVLDSDEDQVAMLRTARAGGEPTSREKTKPNQRPPSADSNTSGEVLATTATQRQGRRGVEEEEETSARKLEEVRRFFENYYATQLQALADTQRRVECEVRERRAPDCCTGGSRARLRKG